MNEVLWVHVNNAICKSFVFVEHFLFISTYDDFLILPNKIMKRKARNKNDCVVCQESGKVLPSKRPFVGLNNFAFEIKV